MDMWTWMERGLTVCLLIMEGVRRLGGGEREAYYYNLMDKNMTQVLENRYTDGCGIRYRCGNGTGNISPYIDKDLSGGLKKRRGG